MAANPEVRITFWTAKYQRAKAAHAAEVRKMGVGGPGASFGVLERTSRQMEYAARQVRKYEQLRKEDA